MRIRYNCVQLRCEALTLCSHCWYNNKEKFKKHHSAFCFWGQGGVNTRPQGTGVGHQRCVSTGSSDSPGGSVLNHQQTSSLRGAALRNSYTDAWGSMTQVWQWLVSRLASSEWSSRKANCYNEMHRSGNQKGDTISPQGHKYCCSVWEVFCLLYQSVQTWAQVRKDLKPYLLHLKYLNLCVDFQLRVTVQIN